MRFQRVGGSAHEALDAQVLLQRLEEQSHLPALLGPVKDLGAEIDDGAVQTKQLGGQFQTRCPSGRAGSGGEAVAQQGEQSLIDLPGVVLVGIDERGMRRGLLDAEVHKQVAFAGEQTFFNLAQALSLAELAEEHRHELIPRAEAPRMALSPQGGFVLAGTDSYPSRRAPSLLLGRSYFGHEWYLIYND